MRRYLRIMAPLTLAYVAGAAPNFWASAALLAVAQGVAIALWSEE